MGFTLENPSPGERRLGRQLPIVYEKSGQPMALAIVGIGLFFAGLPTAAMLLGFTHGTLDWLACLICAPFLLIGLWLIKLGLKLFFDRVGIAIQDGAVAFRRRGLWDRFEFTESLSSYKILGQELDFSNPGVMPDAGGSVCRVVLKHDVNPAMDIELYRSSDSAGLKEETAAMAALLGLPVLEQAPAQAEVARTEALGAAFQRVRMSAAAFALVCVAAGGYAVYIQDLSGRRLALLPFEENNVMRLGPVDIATGGQSRGSVGPVALSPEMNPVRVLLSARYSPQRSSSGAPMSDRDYFRYAVRMKDGSGTQVWEARSRFQASGRQGSSTRSSNKETVNTFDVQAPGQYSFEIDFKPAWFVSVENASLEVRGNVSRMSPSALWIFAACALACVAAGVVFFIQFRIERRAAL